MKPKDARRGEGGRAEPGCEQQRLRVVSTWSQAHGGGLCSQTAVPGRE